MQAQWHARKDHTSWCARQIRQAMISRLNGSMTTGFPVMQVLVPMSPLLGLIGTVSGMLEVFDSMALRGNADARSMASGVSARHDLHDDGPRGQHHGPVPGALLQDPGHVAKPNCSRTS